MRKAQSRELSIAQLSGRFALGDRAASGVTVAVDAREGGAMEPFKHLMSDEVPSLMASQLGRTLRRFGGGSMMRP